MRVSSYDPAALEAEIGPRGKTVVNSANRDKVQNWLVANGVPSARAKAMKLATLWKFYNQPRYLPAVLAHLANSGDMLPFEDDGDAAEAARDMAAAPPAIATAAYVPAPAPSGDAAAQLATLIQSLASGAIDEARVVELIHQHAPRPKHTEIVVVDTTGERREIGTQQC